MACGTADQKIAALVAGELGARERIELESHASRCARCDDAMRAAATLSIALDRAFAPLRARTTLLSPARVRLVARAPRPEPVSTAWWRIGLVGRLSEATMALGFAGLMLLGSLDVVQPGGSGSPPSILKEYFRTQPPSDDQGYARWMRLRVPVPTTEMAHPTRLPGAGIHDNDPAGHNEGWLIGEPLG